MNYLKIYSKYLNSMHQSFLDLDIEYSYDDDYLYATVEVPENYNYIYNSNLLKWAIYSISYQIQSYFGQIENLKYDNVKIIDNLNGNTLFPTKFEKDISSFKSKINIIDVYNNGFRFYFVNPKIESIKSEFNPANALDNDIYFNFDYISVDELGPNNSNKKRIISSDIIKKYASITNLSEIDVLRDTLEFILTDPEHSEILSKFYRLVVSYLPEYDDYGIIYDDFEIMSYLNTYGFNNGLKVPVISSGFNWGQTDSDAFEKFIEFIDDSDDLE
jgi:hypothetical protein